jgi:hypothetical protein
MKYLILLLTLTACGPKYPPCIAEFAGQPQLIVIGDSHSYGECRDQSAFVYQIAKNHRLNIFNRAGSGSKVPTHLEQLHSVTVTPADTVIYLAGYNDMLYDGFTPAYQATLAQILSELNASGAKVYVGGILPYLTNRPNAQSFNDSLKAMVLSHPNIRYVPVFETYQAMPEYYKPNGDIHMSDLGQGVLANLFQGHMQ